MFYKTRFFRKETIEEAILMKCIQVFFSGGIPTSSCMSAACNMPVIALLYQWFHNRRIIVSAWRIEIINCPARDSLLCHLHFPMIPQQTCDTKNRGNNYSYFPIFYTSHYLFTIYSIYVQWKPFRSCPTSSSVKQI